MLKLSNSQRVILSHASSRPDGSVLPTPTSLNVNARPVIARLIKAGLIAEQPAITDAEIWRVAKDDSQLMLVLTDTGRAASDTNVEAGRGAEGGDKRRRAPGSRRARRDGGARSPTKQDLLVRLLSRRKGASIGELTEVLGWQPHSVRGAISGTLKKKLGLDVASEVVGARGRVYRIVGSVG